jgi:hypothetical protein
MKKCCVRDVFREVKVTVTVRATVTATATATVKRKQSTHFGKTNATPMQQPMRHLPIASRKRGSSSGEGE